MECRLVCVKRPAVNPRAPNVPRPCPKAATSRAYLSSAEAKEAEMRPVTKLLIAAPLAAGLFAAPAAHADWYRPGWRGGYGWHHHHNHGNPGAIIAGTVLGLGAAAALAGAFAPPPPPPVYYAPPPPVVYAPPPVYYPPRPSVVYAAPPPPAYYPGY